MGFIRKPAQAFETTPRPLITISHVKSDQLAGLGYDPETQTLAAMFRPQSGNTAAVYHYPGITPDQAGQAATMTGTQFRAMIKGIAFLKFQPEPCPMNPDYSE